jgi:sugar-specific transcriptional regulator TrmB
MNQSLDDILKSIDLPPSSQKIYRELLLNGESTARLLAERLSLTRPSTYDHLTILIKKGLVVEREVDHTTYFAVDDVRHIEQTLKEKITVLEEHRKAFTTLLPSMLKQSQKDAPRIKFYEGKEGLHYLVNDVLWYKGETIYTMWPYEEMLHVLGKDALIRFNNRRIQEKINVHTLWPHTSKIKDSYIWSGKDFLTKRRNAPKGTSWSMGYTIYGDKVSFIASSKEVFGFIVQSKDFAELMKVQFDALWKMSK